MPCRSDEEEDAAPPPHGLTAPMKAVHNNGACHADSDGEETESKSDSDVEKEFYESKGIKRKGSAYLKCTEVMRWSTGKDSMLEPAQINHENFHSHEEIYAAEPFDEGSSPPREPD